MFNKSVTHGSEIGERSKMKIRLCVALTAKLVAAVDEFRVSMQRAIACHEQQW
jgi:hypothetical protein